MLLGILRTFVGEWLTTGLSIAALVAAVACYLRLPILGKEAAIGLVAIAVGLAAYSAGYGARAAQDQSQALRDEIKNLQFDAAAAQQLADDAHKRALDLEAARSASDEKVRSYEEHLAAVADSCRLDGSDLLWLQPNGRRPAPAAPRRP